MIVEVMTIVTIMAQPVHATDAILHAPIFYKKSPPIAQPLTAHLERAWKEYRVCEFIASSA